MLQLPGVHRKHLAPETILILRQKVRVQIPEGRYIAKAQLLAAKAAVRYRRGNDETELNVSVIELYEVISVDYVGREA